MRRSDDAGEWFSLHKFQAAGDMHARKTKGFLEHAVPKLTDEFRKREEPVRPESIILCGGVAVSGIDGSNAVKLEIYGSRPNIFLRLEKIRRNLLRRFRPSSAISWTSRFTFTPPIKLRPSCGRR